MKHILVLPSDATACGMYRLRWPGEACMVAGKVLTVQQRQPKIQVDENGNLQGINVGNATVVVLQRPGSYQIPQMIEILQQNGVRVCIDMDDSLSKIDPRNPVHKEYDPRLNHKKNWMHAAAACEMADMVTVTTEALAEEYGKHGRVQVIKNHVPSRYLNILRPENEVPVVTWAGYTKTHPGDLHVTYGAVNQAIVETGARFMAYGDLEMFNHLQIRHRPPNFHQPFVDIIQYPKVLATADIGIVPLKKSDFNEGKSWLKCLEYASVGVVPVASPTPDNLLFAELGGCIIAEKSADWLREIKELILDKDKRTEFSKKVREVASDWTIEGNYSKWYDCWAML